MDVESEYVWNRNQLYPVLKTVHYLRALEFSADDVLFLVTTCRFFICQLILFSKINQQINL